LTSIKDAKTDINNESHKRNYSGLKIESVASPNVNPISPRGQLPSNYFSKLDSAIYSD